MKDRTLRFTPEAIADLARMFEFLAGEDLDLAERAVFLIRRGLDALTSLPFLGRRVEPDATLRELVVPLGKAGYVALYRVSAKYITVLAVRHQREDDYP